MPDELEHILRGFEVRNIQLSGPGAYGRTIPREILVKMMSDDKVQYLSQKEKRFKNRHVPALLVE